MKILIAALFSLVALNAAAEDYCDASEETVSQVQDLRFVELPYQVVEAEIIKLLISDECVKSRLEAEEIRTLTQMLLSFEYNQDTAGQIIGEFLAQ